MSMIFHPETGFDIGDPDIAPLARERLPSRETVLESASSLILSASGWRKVFALHSDDAEMAAWSQEVQAEDSLSPRISDADKVIAALMAKTFGEFILTAAGTPKPTVLLGIDTRPTGPAIADIFVRVLIGMGVGVHNCFIISAPEIMAYAAYAGSLPLDNEQHADGFAYISASHNPPGHNGIKFGLAKGGVLSAAEIAPLIARLKALLNGENPAAEAYPLIQAAHPAVIAECFSQAQHWKRQALSAYILFSHKVITGEAELDGQRLLLDMIAEQCRMRPLGIVAELNGSARSLSMDSSFLEAMNINSKFYNAHPRNFVHRIVPEGDSLNLCMKKLDEMHAADNSFQLGYVPDCDGDRGNLVFYDRHLKQSRLLEAQEVFALSCLAELAFLHAQEKASQCAIAVNDATSMRIEAIASRFGASVFRAETGEANVVGLADSLARQGWLVRVMGEGSNGGTIINPSRVRDPLSTIGALLKLLRLPALPGKPDLFKLWLELSDQGASYRPDYDLTDIVYSLPGWATTSVFEKRAALKVSTEDKTALKRHYQRIFRAEFELKNGELAERYGIVSWKAIASNGIAEKDASTDFSASGSGGLRIVFSDAEGKPKAFIWMRGSGTEPVFRIMADVDGGTSEDEAYFLDWQTAMVRAADASASAAH